MKTTLKKTRVPFFLLAIVSLLFFFPGTAFSESEPPTAYLFIAPVFSDVTLGSYHQVAVRVKDVENLTAFDLLIRFDPEIIEITDVKNGGFLVAPDEPAFYAPENNDGTWNTDGFIRFGMAQQGDGVSGVNPKSGKGNLILITMKAVSFPGTATLEIDETTTKLVWFGQDPDDPDGPVDGALIPYVPRNGEVTILGEYYFPIIEY